MAPRRTRSESRARYYIREEAKNRGWNISHVAAGGNFLEENEIASHFPNIGLSLDRPDFLICLGGDPTVVVEVKNDAKKIQEAIDEATEYAEKINATGRYDIKVAVGAAGEEDTGFVVVTRYRSAAGWVPLTSSGQEITTIPSISEVELALKARDGTTKVSIPGSAEFIDAAVEISALLRAAKVEAPLRPKVIGAIVIAMYQGDIDAAPENALGSVNALISEAIEQARDIAKEKKLNL